MQHGRRFGFKVILMAQLGLGAAGAAALPARRASPAADAVSDRRLEQADTRLAHRETCRGIAQ